MRSALPAHSSTLQPCTRVHTIIPSTCALPCLTIFIFVYSCPRSTARASGPEAPLLLSFFFLLLLDQSTRFSSFLLPSLSANVRCVCTLGLWRCTRLSMMILTQMRGTRSPRKSRFVVCCKGDGRVCYRSRCIGPARHRSVSSCLMCNIGSLHRCCGASMATARLCSHRWGRLRRT